MPDSSVNRSVDMSRSMIAPLLKEPVVRYTLPNGLIVLLKHSSSAAVCSVQAWVKTGSIHEGELLGAGVSHFVEHMLFKGTERREGREVSQEVQAAGGYINAYTTFDRTVYYIDLPSENVDTAIDVLNDCLFHSTMPADEVEKEREVIMREIAMGDDDPDSQLSQALFETVFKEHPYRYPIIGYKDVFSDVTREQLWEYYKTRYVPNNTVLVVTGDFQEIELRASIEASFGSEKRRALAPVFLPEEPSQLAERSAVLFEDVQISRLGLGYQVPGLTDAETPALDVLSMILGNGNSSLLNLQLREHLKLVHYVDVSNWTPGSVGVFYIAMLADVDKRDAALSAFKQYMQSLSEADFSQELIDKAVRQILSSEVNSRKTVSGDASRLGSAEVVVGDIGYTKNYLQRVTHITSFEVFHVFEKWVKNGNASFVSIDPKGTVVDRSMLPQRERASFDFEELIQPNGSALLLRHDDRLPNLHFRLVYQAGALFEDPGLQGLTNLLATLLTKDTEKRDSEEVANAIESVGGSFYEFAGNNSLGLALEVMPQDLDLALDLLGQAIGHIAFDQETFEVEKESQIASIKENLDDVVSTGREILRKKFFGDHPFAIGATGNLETVERLDLDTLERFWKRINVAENLTLAVSGGATREDLLPRLESLLATVPNGELAKPETIFNAPLEVGQHRIKMDRQQAVVYQAYPGPGLKHDDFYISEVADELFSGMSSVLFERVREELSLAYFVRSERIIGLDAAMFYFYAGTAPERYEEVIVELNREIERVKAGAVSEKELSDCKVRLKAGRRMGMQSNSSCSSQAAMNVAYGLPVNDWQNFDSLIDAVTIDDLKGFALKYFVPSKCVELVVGPISESP